MQLSPTDAYRLYRPSNCELRLYLHHHGVKETEPGPFEQVIRRLGERHERVYLAGFPNPRPPSGYDGVAEDRYFERYSPTRAGALSVLILR
jgi:hypothetical protein